MMVRCNSGIQTGGKVEIFPSFSNENAAFQIAVDIGAGYRRIDGFVVIVI
jgi:hypothetical protein